MDSIVPPAEEDVKLLESPTKWIVEISSSKAKAMERT